MNQNMINKISGVTCLLAVTIVLGFGCASKKKQEEVVPPATGEITSQPLEMDSLGSDSGKIQGLETVYFEYDRSTLTQQSVQILRGNAEWLQQNSQYNLQIEGHCDARGSIEYNLALGERRAKAVRAQLVKLGIPSNRLSVVSYGKEKPLAMGDSEQAYSQNRRANFVPLK
jgi:peptidoglycan-associated lipoprotein